jgi:hypothetical protein
LRIRMRSRCRHRARLHGPKRNDLRSRVKTLQAAEAARSTPLLGSTSALMTC